jgi:hypothetical protein
MKQILIPTDFVSKENKLMKRTFLINQVLFQAARMLLKCSDNYWLEANFLHSAFKKAHFLSFFKEVYLTFVSMPK